MTYKMDKFLKATVPLDQGMGALAIMLHLCILLRVLVYVSKSDSSVAKRVIVRASVIAQGVLWILMLFGAIRYLALLSSYELLSEAAAVLLVPVTMVFFLVVTFIYMLLFEAAARTVWKPLYVRVARRFCSSAADEPTSDDCDSVDVAVEEAGSICESVDEETDEDGEVVVVEAEQAKSEAGWAAKARQLLFAVVASFQEEYLYLFRHVVAAVVAPWRAEPISIVEEATEQKCDVELEERGNAPDIAAEEAQTTSDSSVEEVPEGELAASETTVPSLAEEGLRLWARFTRTVTSALSSTAAPSGGDHVPNKRFKSSSRWLWAAWWLVAIAVLVVALVYGAWDVHVSCSYCAHQEYGVKNTKYERQADPPYVCAMHDICHSYIVLPEDGSNSMAVVFHTSEPPASVASVTMWRVPEDDAGLWGSCDGRAECAQATETTVEAPLSEWQVPCATIEVDMEVPRFVSQCALTELASATIYAYSPSYLAQDGVLVHGETHFFRTLPADEQPLTFVVGGDLALDTNITNSMADLAAAEVPWFVGLGGDLTYDNGLMACYYRWDSMVNLVEEHLVINTTLRHSTSSQIYLQIPVVLVIGNHESGGYGIPIEDAPPYLWDYFPHRISLIQSLTPEDVMAPVMIHKLDLSKRGAEAYHGHVLGYSASLLALDTMQVTSMEPGEPQQLFIEESLQSMRERKWTLSMHHVPLYPSSFASPKGEVLRAYWEDLFLDGGVDIAFEHHEHSYKRNHLVAHEEHSPEGILYLGGGAWGVKPFLKDRDFSYLHKRMKLRNFLVITITEERVMMLAKDEDNNIIDAVALERDANSRSKVLHELCDESVVCQVDPSVTS